ncbi:multidrug efflux SMR transporter [Bacillus gobiensis]|uniref:DMT family transporter n=1 Tax=Bacillus gobiensis TaxID=1441095 RepID=UPI003D21E4DC
MNWFYLLLAILLEVAGTASMKFSDGLTKIVPSILMVPFYAASFTFLAFSLKTLDVSVAYAIWSGMGIILITIIGFFYFGEQLSGLKILAILLIVTGVVILNFTGEAH